jgi:hypothetical protein
MAPISFPTEQEIRDALLRRADEFSRQTGMSKSEIGKRALNDGAFLGQVSKGRNFTIELYRRLMDWLDANWPDREERRLRRKTSRRLHGETRKALGSAKPPHRNKAAAPTSGHFSQFKHLRVDRFRTAAEIEDYINRLRDEWSHR